MKAQTEELSNKEPVQGFYAIEINRIERQYWYHMTSQEQERAATLAQELVELMARVATAVKHSPLLDEADEREIVTYTKTKRSALYLRRYFYSAPEPIHTQNLQLWFTTILDWTDKYLQPTSRSSE